MVPEFDFNLVLVFFAMVGALFGAAALAFFIFVPLSWHFYAGLFAGVGLALFVRWFVVSFLKVDFE
jgi:hypothetical protein